MILREKSFKFQHHFEQVGQLNSQLPIQHLYIASCGGHRVPTLVVLGDQKRGPYERPGNLAKSHEKVVYNNT